MGAERKIVPRHTVSLGKRHDDKKFKVRIVASRDFVRGGCSQSEFQVTHFFSCSEEFSEVFGDKI